MSKAIRSLVSKKKVRFTQDGFDLDLTYITKNIIAMGFPSEGSEAAYRNPMEDVQRFFETRHKGKFRIINLCSERAYDASKFGGESACAHFPFDDHNPAPLWVIKAACEDMAAFLEKDTEHVVAIHCKAGKGRTGMIISALLLRLGIAAHATDALKLFGNVRTSNGKGVTIPSQMRYVHYYETMLRRGGEIPAPKWYKLRHIRFITVPNFDVGGGCDPYFDVRVCLPKDKEDPRGGQSMVKIFNMKKAHGGKVENYQPKHKFVDLDLTEDDLLICGDVKFVFYDFDKWSADDKIGHLWFNTAFIDNNYLLFHKPVIDRACKDKTNEHFDPDFKIEFFFEPTTETRDFLSIGEEVDDDRDDPAGEDEPATTGPSSGAASGGGGEASASD